MTFIKEKIISLPLNNCRIIILNNHVKSFIKKK